uniref:ORF17 n=1 Tax=Zea mays TaxID=4577 RepID=Q8HAS3_MAIZE|nr:ORF17 [Zea mays]AAN40756.1 unknown [Zea mays]ADI79270.1 ORF17 [Zea mays]
MFASFDSMMAFLILFVF